MMQILVCSNHSILDGKYKTNDKKTYLKNVDLVYFGDKSDDQDSTLENYINYGTILGEGTTNARFWANEQPSEMNPRSLEILCRKIAEENRIHIDVIQVCFLWKQKLMKQAPELISGGLNMINAVGQGSACPPRLILMEYAYVVLFI